MSSGSFALAFRGVVHCGTLLALCGVAACGPSSLTLGEPSCDASAAADWFIVGAIVRSGSTDGTLDEDPPGDLITAREGRYNPRTGALSFTDTFADGYRYTGAAWDGFGTVFDNGDADLELTRTLVHADGGETVHAVRILRSGCDVEWVEREGDTVVWLENATFKGDVYDFRVDRLQANVIATGRGERSADGETELTDDWRIGDVEHHWTREIRSDGEEVATFEVLANDRVAQGEVEVRTGGSTAWEFDVVDVDGAEATWELGLGPAGNGRGLVTFKGTFEDIECDLEIEDGDCSIEDGCEEAPRPPCWRVELDGTDRSSACCTQ